MPDFVIIDGGQWVDYGMIDWPTWSVWLVPGTWSEKR
jgi:hypothetical protein